MHTGQGSGIQCLCLADIRCRILFQTHQILYPAPLRIGKGLFRLIRRGKNHSVHGFQGALQIASQLTKGGRGGKHLTVIAAQFQIGACVLRRAGGILVLIAQLGPEQVGHGFFRIAGNAVVKGLTGLCGVLPQHIHAAQAAVQLGLLGILLAQGNAFVQEPGRPVVVGFRNGNLRRLQMDAVGIHTGQQGFQPLKPAVAKIGRRIHQILGRGHLIRSLIPQQRKVNIRQHTQKHGDDQGSGGQSDPQAITSAFFRLLWLLGSCVL